jgi:GNAT superfamily N-acetyltransferase
VTLKLETRPVCRSDEAAMTTYANMLRRWLYPSDEDPMDQILRAEAIFAAQVEGLYVGFASVNRFASPDGQEDDGSVLWFEDSVVVPEWRRRGVNGLLQEDRMNYARAEEGRILTSSISPERDAYLERHG